MGEKARVRRVTVFLTMRFSHTADCHIGGHRDPRLRKLTEKAFEQFVTNSIEDDVNFCLIAGDLFNTAIPGIDALKFTVQQLGRLKEKSIPVYAVPGSHDFSPSGRTMLDVLEEAKLLTNVFQGEVENDKLKLSFTTDEKTGVKLTGILGKRGMLDKQLYEELDRTIENESGEKIFLFHTALTELKPDAMVMDSQPVSFLPKNFTYYAGGHVHIVKRYEGEEHKNIVYPGPLFPNSFSELEELEHGGYFLFDNGTITRKEINLIPVTKIHVNVDGMAGSDADSKLKELLPKEIDGSIVLLRIEGKLATGSPSDIDLRHAVNQLEKGAYAVLRNTTRLTSAEFQEVTMRHDEQHDIEAALLKEHEQQLKLEGLDGPKLAEQLLKTLSREQKEGEKIYEYEENVVKEALELLNH